MSGKNKLLLLAAVVVVVMLCACIGAEIWVWRGEPTGRRDSAPRMDSDPLSAPYQSSSRPA